MADHKCTKCQDLGVTDEQPYQPCKHCTREALFARIEALEANAKDDTTHILEAEERITLWVERAEQAEILLASTTDFANTWARECCVGQAKRKEDIKALVERLWERASITGAERDQAVAQAAVAMKTAAENIREREQAQAMVAALREALRSLIWNFDRSNPDRLPQEDYDTSDGAAYELQDIAIREGQDALRNTAAAAEQHDQRIRASLDNKIKPILQQIGRIEVWLGHNRWPVSPDADPLDTALKALRSLSEGAERIRAEGRREGLEEAAAELDNLATCELMQDCLDDLARARPYQRAAKRIRALIDAPPEPTEQQLRNAAVERTREDNQ